MVSGTNNGGHRTGLGLATVHGIVGQHQGWIEVESKIAQGTTFQILLPAASKSLIKNEQTQELKLARGNETILLVEDEHSVRKVTAQSLRLLGYTVLEAANGPEAIHLWEQHHSKVDLLLSDMVMPEGLTGLELMQKLRKRKPGLKVIICSGYNAEKQTQGLTLDKYIIRLQKPYRLETLSLEIRQCLDKE